MNKERVVLHNHCTLPPAPSPMLQEISQPPNLHFFGITPRPHDWDAVDALICALGRKEVLQDIRRCEGGESEFSWYRFGCR